MSLGVIGRFSLAYRLGCLQNLVSICSRKYQYSPSKITHLLKRGPAIKKATMHFCSTATQEDATILASPSEIYSNPTEQAAITGGDPELEKKLRILCLEHDVWRQEGTQVPSSLRVDQWQHVLTLETRSKRKKFYKFLFGIEQKKKNDKIKKQQRAQERMERKAAEPEEQQEGLKYHLGHNSFLLRIYDTTINNLYNSNVIRAMMFSQKIVIDCDYDNHMTPQESSNCAKQIIICFAENRVHADPFDLHLCNVNKNSPTIRKLNKSIPNMYEEDFPLNVSEKSYIDLFPRQNIVYLTPHCKTELHKYDHDAVYIIGAMVDKGTSEPYSLAKAKREGLKMAKLPLELYLNWGQSAGKSLTLNQMMLIMLDMRWKEDWNFALRHVPRRKVVSDEEYFSQSDKFKARNNNFAGRLEQRHGNKSRYPRKLSTPDMFVTSLKDRN